MKYILLIGILLVSEKDSVALSIHPPNGDTTAVSFVLDGLSPVVGNYPSFSCNFHGKSLHKDSVLWTIDGIPVDTSDAYISHGPSVNKTLPYDPRSYATGTSLSLHESASKAKYSQRFHELQLVARYDDTTITASWTFRHFETQYNLVDAYVKVVSDINNAPGCHSTRCYKHTLIKASPVNEDFLGLFELNVELPNYISVPANILTYYTSSEASYILGDTIHCYLLQITRHKDAYTEWLLSQPFDSILVATTPPFELKSALKAFNQYLIKNNAYRGASPPNGDLFLGPLYQFYRDGDPGWKVSATHDHESWIIAHTTGKGDCPAGCAIFEKKHYKITKSGEVIVLPDNFTGLKFVSHAIRPSLKKFNRKGYDFLGRKTTQYSRCRHILEWHINE